jgi:hypothetical protein
LPSTPSPYAGTMAAPMPVARWQPMPEPRWQPMDQTGGASVSPFSGMAPQWGRAERPPDANPGVVAGLPTPGPRMSPTPTPGLDRERYNPRLGFNPETGEYDPYGNPGETERNKRPVHERSGRPGR